MHDETTDQNTPLPSSPSPNLPTDRRALLAGIGGLAAGALFAGKANAGPLNPPPGPIQSTPGPEPRIPINSTNTPGNSAALFRITAPGSYYLTGNIVGQAGRSGISIESSGVTLDLMGFNMRGVSGSLDGISMSVNSPRIVIRNGTISGWVRNGIRARINGGAIEGIHVSNNGAWGISNEGGGSLRVWGCTATSNGASVFNSGGIRTVGDSTIHSCHARNNVGTGIRSGLGSMILECVANLNTGDGMSADSNCLLLHNFCLGNTGAGILTDGSRTRIDANNCTDNGVGIRTLGTFSLITRNTCAANDTNWMIAPLNYCFVAFAAITFAINGNSGGNSSGITDPNANFTY